jgi:hypothetical protein
MRAAWMLIAIVSFFGMIFGLLIDYTHRDTWSCAILFVVAVLTFVALFFYDEYSTEVTKDKLNPKG